MGGSFRVSPEQLQGTAGELRAGAAEIDGISDELRTVVGALRGEWSGAASDGFERLWDQWGAAAAGLQEALDGVSRLLAEAGRNYADVEGRITAGLGG